VTTLVRDGNRALQGVRSHAATLATTVGVWWIVYVVNLVLGGALFAYGIHPRTLAGLVGIVFAPFLHASVMHLALNTLSFVFLGAFMRFRHRSDLAVVGVVGALTSGLGAWLLGGAGTVTVGASGVIFAYLGFLMARGIFERSAASIALSVLVTWLFGSMVWGVLPTVAAAISWQAHLFGFLGGVICAAQLAGSRNGRR
jgi:membrane associated rhomboid family serine protease